MIAYIPTKGRYNTKTYQLFEAAGIPVLHFIEQQEINKYEVPNKINIGANNNGIGFVRNFMLNYAKTKGEKWVIFCDDDVTEFGYAKDMKCITHDASIWRKVQELAKDLKFNIYGLNYRQHAWHEKKQYSINKSFVEVCVMMDIESISWQYRSEFNLKEDRDFILQSIKYGQGFVKFHKLYYNCPDVGSNKGGLFNEYQNKVDAISAKKMAYEWHPHIELKERNGRLDMKVDIPGIANKYNKIVK